MKIQLSRSIPSRAAFTLIEMLVVIAIIALLSSILVPVVNKARIRAGRTACMSNLRSIYQAGMSWSVDNDQRLVPAEVNRHPVWGRRFWYSQVLPYLDQKSPCPRARTSWHWGYGMNVFPNKRYGDNRKNIEYYKSSGEKETGTIFTHDMVRQPSTTLYLLDYQEWQFDRYLNYKNPSQFPLNRHGDSERVPSVFYDGSMHFVSFDESILAGGFDL